VLEDSTEILDADDNVELVLDLNIIEFVNINCDVSVEGLLEDSYAGRLAIF